MQIIRTLSWISGFGFLGWTEVIAALFVAAGCLGELWIVLNKLTRTIEPLAKNAGVLWKLLAWGDSVVRPVILRLKIKGRKLPEAKEHLLERFLVMLVALGVGVELICLMFSLQEIAKLNNEAGQARKEAGEANERAAKADLARVELENEIAPRDVDEHGFSESLRRLQGMRVLVLNVPDFEARRFASHLSLCLKLAGWEIVGHGDVEEVRSGVIATYSDADGWPRNKHLRGAAESVVKELMDRGVTAMASWPMPNMIAPTNSLVIIVGGKPNRWEAKLWNAASRLQRASSPVERSNSWENFMREQALHIEDLRKRGIIPTNRIQSK